MNFTSARRNLPWLVLRYRRYSGLTPSNKYVAVQSTRYAPNEIPPERHKTYSLTRECARGGLRTKNNTRARLDQKFPAHLRGASRNPKVPPAPLPPTYTSWRMEREIWMPLRHLWENASGAARSSNVKRAFPRTFFAHIWGCFFLISFDRYAPNGGVAIFEVPTFWPNHKKRWIVVACTNQHVFIVAVIHLSIFGTYSPNSHSKLLIAAT